MSHIEENLERDGKFPSFYRRYVDDTLTIMPNIETASNFLDTLNKAHSSVKIHDGNRMPWNAPISGYPVAESIAAVETKVYVKPTNSGLLLHCQSHVDNGTRRVY